MSPQGQLIAQQLKGIDSYNKVIGKAWHSFCEEQWTGEQIASQLFLSCNIVGWIWGVTSAIEAQYAAAVRLNEPWLAKWLRGQTIAKQRSALLILLTLFPQISKALTGNLNSCQTHSKSKFDAQYCLNVVLFVVYWENTWSPFPAWLCIHFLVL